MKWWTEKKGLLTQTTLRSDSSSVSLETTQFTLLYLTSFWYIWCAMHATSMALRMPNSHGWKTEAIAKSLCKWCVKRWAVARIRIHNVCVCIKINCIFESFEQCISTEHSLVPSLELRVLVFVVGVPSFGVVNDGSDDGGGGNRKRYMRSEAEGELYASLNFRLCNRES